MAEGDIEGGKVLLKRAAEESSDSSQAAAVGRAALRWAARGPAGTAGWLLEVAASSIDAVLTEMQLLGDALVSCCSSSSLSCILPSCPSFMFKIDEHRLDGHLSVFCASFVVLCLLGAASRRAKAQYTNEAV